MKHIQIKTCKDCNKVLSRENTSGYCRSCSPKHSIIDYSKREIDYSKREIDYDSRDSLFYKRDKEYNDRVFQCEFAQVFLSYYKLGGGHTTIIFSHQKMIEKYGRVNTLRTLNQLESIGAIRSTGLFKYQGYYTNEYSVNPEKLESLIFNWKEHKTPYLVYYFGKSKIKRTTKKAQTYTKEQLDIVENYISQGALLEEQSDRVVTIDSYLDNIEKYCQNSGKDSVSKDRFFESLRRALDYGKDNHTEVVFRPKKKAIKDHKGNIIRYDYTARFWNTVCDTRSEEHSETERADFLKSKGLENASHWDVPSSIPNTINYRKAGTWECIDWHTKMAEMTGFSRDLVKYLSLPCCFAAQNYNVKKLMTNLKYHYDNDTARGKEFKEILNTKDQGLTPEKLKEGLDIMLSTYKTSKSKYLFFFESELYLKVWEKLKAMGIKCFMVYDSFYTDKEVDIVPLIKEASEELNQKWGLKSTKATTKVAKSESKVVKPVVTTKEVKVTKVVPVKMVAKIEEKKVFTKVADTRLVDSEIKIKPEVKIVKPVSKVDLMYQTSWSSLL